jgi:hypothetical protein
VSGITVKVSMFSWFIFPKQVRKFITHYSLLITHYSLLGIQTPNILMRSARVGRNISLEFFWIVTIWINPFYLTVHKSKEIKQKVSIAKFFLQSENPTLLPFLHDRDNLFRRASILNIQSIVTMAFRTRAE